MHPVTTAIQTLIQSTPDYSLERFLEETGATTTDHVAPSPKLLSMNE